MSSCKKCSEGSFSTSGSSSCIECGNQGEFFSISQNGISCTKSCNDSTSYIIEGDKDCTNLKFPYIGAKSTNNKFCYTNQQDARTGTSDTSKYCNLPSAKSSTNNCNPSTAEIVNSSLQTGCPVILNNDQVNQFKSVTETAALTKMHNSCYTVSSASIKKIPSTSTKTKPKYKFNGLTNQQISDCCGNLPPNKCQELIKCEKKNNT